MKRNIPTLFCVGINHESAGLDFRESLYLEPEQIEDAIPALTKKHQISELMALSTCNRLEIYGVIDASETSGNHLKEIFIDLQSMTDASKSDLADEIRKHSYHHTHYEAAKHAFSVSSGLNSLVLGETQIAGQFKKAAAKADSQGLLGPILKRLTQEAFAASKKIRSQTDISRRPVSISHAAIDLANRLFGQVSDHKLLIVGAGEMAEIAAKYALKYKPKDLFIVNRTYEKAVTLTENLGQGEAFSWDELSALLVRADIIICSTAANGLIITKDMMTKAQKARGQKPSFLIDIALPRDIAPACSDLEEVFVFDIDDLKQVVDENYEQRRNAAKQGIALIDESAKGFTHWLNHIDLKPALSDYRKYLERLFEQELTKSLARGALSEIDTNQEQALKRLLKSVMDKMCGDAAISIHNPPNNIPQEMLAASLATMFAANEEDDTKETENHGNSKPYNNCH